MSKIINYEKSSSCTSSSRTGKPVEVSCLYETQTFDDGEKMLVIKTYNPSSVNAKISQTIHFTKESAIHLIEILKSELNI